MSATDVQPLGPDPVLLSRKEVDALYEVFEAIIKALDHLQVDYIVTGGSLLGAIRQHSILFCDDDIDIAIVGSSDDYQKVTQNLQQILGSDYHYSIKCWEGGDKVRSKKMSSVFVDIFCLQRYDTEKQLLNVIGKKTNGQAQSQEYIDGIRNKMYDSLQQDNNNNTKDDVTTCTDTCCCYYPLWHFNTRKAIEMWPKEVYREQELFPLRDNLKFGPLTVVKGPHMPILLLKRAFGKDCFEVYYQGSSFSHKNMKTPDTKQELISSKVSNSSQDQDSLLLKPRILGGDWEGGEKVALQDEHYQPMMPTSRAKRRLTGHNKQQLFDNIKLMEQDELETLLHTVMIPNRTIYMDGVFDLFHVGHLQAIRQCAGLGTRVVIGVTGDEDATSYKRAPIICQEERTAIVSALKGVHQVICPCPLVVTPDFMKQHGIDLVVHGFASEADAERQYEFFQYPIETGRFQRISYYDKLSTTDIMNKIRSME